MFSSLWAPTSAEGEGVGRYTRIEELDFEGVIGNVPTLPYQLIEALSRHNALTLGVDIAAVARARCFPVDGDAEADRLAVSSRAEHQMQVARVKAVDDAAALCVK